MNYKKVIEDYKSGKIDKSVWHLAIDNDGGRWDYVGDIEDWEEVDKVSEEMERKYGLPSGYRDVVKILEAVGVPADWV